MNTGTCCLICKIFFDSGSSRKKEVSSTDKRPVKNRNSVSTSNVASTAWNEYGGKWNHEQKSFAKAKFASTEDVFY